MVLGCHPLSNERSLIGCEGLSWHPPGRVCLLLPGTSARRGGEDAFSTPAPSSLNSERSKRNPLNPIPRLSMHGGRQWRRGTHCTCEGCVRGLSPRGLAAGAQ